MSEVKLDDIVSLAKRRGFIYPSSEIYGGLAGVYDYGPLGVKLKHNIQNLWWNSFVASWEDMYPMDAAILMNKKVWEASGHASGFNDPLIECGTGNCSMRYRVDQLIDEYKGSEKLGAYIKLAEKIKNDFFVKHTHEQIPHLMTRLIAEYYMNDPQRLKLREFSEKYNELKFERGALSVELYLQRLLENAHLNSLSFENRLNDDSLEQWYNSYVNNPWHDLAIQLFLNKNVKCKNCGARYWAVPRPFNMMFKTNTGPVENDNSVTYLRPETAQGMFVNFKNIVDTFSPDMPFGLAQIGKSFRNEISPREFLFRLRELEMMEIEYFVHPDTWEKTFESWRLGMQTYFKLLGLPEDKIHELEVPETDRAHYSHRTIDFEFDFPFGKKELAGLAYRTDYDLKKHQETSGKNIEYRPKDGSEPFIPHVIEPSMGVERLVLAVLSSAYTEDEQNGEKRVYLKLPTELAPVKVAVFPLLKNKPELVAKAREVYEMLKKEIPGVMWDDNGNIGKRYRRQDEIGTPHTITIDFQTLDDDTITLRNRDTTEQARVKISELFSKL